MKNKPTAKEEFGEGEVGEMEPIQRMQSNCTVEREDRIVIKIFEKRVGTQSKAADWRIAQCFEKTRSVAKR